MINIETVNIKFKVTYYIPLLNITREKPHSKLLLNFHSVKCKVSYNNSSYNKYKHTQINNIDMNTIICSWHIFFVVQLMSF